MEFVLTLIAARDGELDDAIVAEARSALNALGAETGSPDWLHPAIACDVGFERIVPDQAEAAARTVIGEAAIDVVAQPTEGRRKRLLIADMDSTIVTTESLDHVARRAGIEEVIAEITRRTMNGELEFEDSLRQRVAMLKDLAESVLADAYAEIELTPGATVVPRTMTAHGAYTALISGGFDYFTARVAERCGFAEQRANRFEIASGKLTGKVIEPVLGRDAKYRTLVELATRHGLPLAEALAVGDGANDIDMITAAGLGVAFRGKPILRAAAPAKLDHVDLTGLLYLQGYRHREFVEA